jgi:hypothetical protein
VNIRLFITVGTIMWCGACSADVAPREPDALHRSRFTVNRDGTVHDLRTGLLWEPPVRADADKLYTAVDAEARCAGLTLAGEGWRLPTKSELESIIDDAREGPALDPVTFRYARRSGKCWSSSRYVGANEVGRWVVDLGDGSDDAFPDSEPLFVWCVRYADGAPPARYTWPANGTVYDTRTGLTWQQSYAGSAELTDVPVSYWPAWPYAFDNPKLCAFADKGMGTWAHANKYCADLWLLGPGWRLPTRAELRTLVDITKFDPAIDAEAFPGVPSFSVPYGRTPRCRHTSAAMFWSSSPFNRGEVWLVDFSNGSLEHLASSSSVFGVRCVR